MAKEHKEISFAKIPNNLLKITTAKTVLLACYLRLYANIDGWVNFSINFLATKLGFKPNSNKGRINQQLLEIIRELKTEKFQNAILFYEEPDSYKKCVALRINNKNEKVFDPKSDYTVITTNEFNKIIEMHYRHPENILAIYLQIKRFSANTDRAHQTYFTGSISNIRDEITFSIENGISEKTISNLLDDMVEEGLLNKRAGKLINKNGRFIRTPSHYAAMDTEINQKISDKLFLAHYGTLLDED